MLTLSRRVGEKLLIDPDIQITVVNIKKSQVQLGIDAPDNIKVYRDELYPISVTAESDASIQNKLLSTSTKKLAELINNNFLERVTHHAPVQGAFCFSAIEKRRIKKLYPALVKRFISHQKFSDSKKDDALLPENLFAGLDAIIRYTLANPAYGDGEKTGGYYLHSTARWAITLLNLVNNIDIRAW